MKRNWKSRCLFGLWLGILLLPLSAGLGSRMDRITPASLSPDRPNHWGFVRDDSDGPISSKQLFAWSTISTNVAGHELSAAVLPWDPNNPYNWMVMVWWDDLTINGFSGGTQLEGYYLFPNTIRLEDITGDGIPELVIQEWVGGNAWCNFYNRILEIQSFGLREITPELPETWVVNEIRDVDGDGVAELLVLVADYEFYAYHCHAASPGYKQVFAWDQAAGQYEDRSYAFPDFYEPDIKSLREQLAGEDIPEYTSGFACSLMLIMGALGRAEAEVPEFQQYMAKVAEQYDPSVVAEVTSTIMDAALAHSRQARSAALGE